MKSSCKFLGARYKSGDVYDEVVEKLDDVHSNSRF